MNSFAPCPQTTNALRRAFGQFATGVTVVTAAGPQGPIGITANSFTSVSLDPPLILWCPAKSSARHDPLLAPDQFALHVLGADQQALAQGFSRRADAFDLCDWKPGADGTPLIEGCAARFECSVNQRFDAGDHSIVLARVRRVVTRDGDALVFHRGQYGGFQQGGAA